MLRKVWMTAMLLLVAGPIMSAESGSTEPENKLATVKKAVVSKLHDLSESFKVKKVEPNRWTSVIEGVKDIENRVAEIRHTIQEIQVKGETAKIDQADFDKQLVGIQAEFKRLAEEAGTENGLPEPLAKYAAKEKDMWLHWAGVTVTVKDVYGHALDRVRDQTTYFKRLDPMLVRFDRGAKNIINLTNVLNQVDQIDKLSQMAEQINQIITIFDAMADQTKNAVAQIEGKQVVEPEKQMVPIPESRPQVAYPQPQYRPQYQSQPQYPVAQTYQPAVRRVDDSGWQHVER
jgi:hypothetical protein